MLLSSRDFSIPYSFLITLPTVLLVRPSLNLSFESCGSSAGPQSVQESTQISHAVTRSPSERTWSLSVILYLLFPSTHALTPPLSQQASASARFLKLSTPDILDWKIFLWGQGQVCSVHWSTPGALPTERPQQPPQSWRRQCLHILANVPWGQNYPRWKLWPRVNGKRAAGENTRVTKDRREGRKDNGSRGICKILFGYISVTAD